MWKKNNQIKINNSNEMALILTTLRQNPQPAMISFDSTEDGLTHILNGVTFPQCNVAVFQNATNIHFWNYITK